MWRQHATTGAAEPVAAPGRKMLAVLPFENRGPPADDYFADGLTEAIGLRLGGVRSLGVIASQSARQYKGTTKSLAQIGRELRVQYVLRGLGLVGQDARRGPGAGEPHAPPGVRRPAALGG